MIFKKDSNLQLTRNFNSNEFDCKCNKCTETKLNFQLVLLLQHIREKLNTSVAINSGYRCPGHNAAVGGAEQSQHLKGNAADIKAKGIPPSVVAAECENLFSGLGKYDTFTHVDVRESKSRW